MVLGGGFYLLLNLYAFVVSDKLIFAPQAPSYSHLPNEIKIESGAGKTINAVFLEHPDADYTILFSHGNAEDLGNVVPFMQRFYDLGYSVLMYDYRGYGTSEGSPSTKKAKQDATAAYRWLVEEKMISPEMIISHGRSLGGGVATWLAANHKVGGLVIECSFASAFRVKTRWPLLPWDKFNNLRSIKKINVPVLDIHGVDDEIIPIWHAKKLYAAAPGIKMKLWIEGGRHNDYVYVAEDAYLESYQSFMELVEEYHNNNVE
jgi:fermentation-respiration switch protein FrsA (DUF1100 family)